LKKQYAETKEHLKSKGTFSRIFSFFSGARKKDGKTVEHLKDIQSKIDERYNKKRELLTGFLGKHSVIAGNKAKLELGRINKVNSK
jgi:hypothetical protein